MPGKLLFAIAFMLALPMWFSPSKDERAMKSPPFASVVYAGHTLLGSWCDCGAPGCICDPGEGAGGNSARPISDASTVQPNPKPKAGRVSELDFGAGALLIVFALLMWTRLRS
jgi:hypothetical protein